MSANLQQYSTAFDISQAFVDLLEISKYPIDVFDIPRHKNGAPILCSTLGDYRKWFENCGKKYHDEIKDAKCYFDPRSGVYIIVYNEKKSDKRIRFSIAHELGHIVLGHLDDKRTEICRGGLDDVTYFAMEGAANTFAGNLLAPPILIHERLCGNQFNVLDIACFFQLSASAVRTYRKADYFLWEKKAHSVHETNILARCKSFLFPHYCKKCMHISYLKNSTYCPICGNKTTPLQAGDDETMGKTYPSVELNEYGQVKECLICKNEEHLSEADYCMICGKPIVNRCTYALSEEVSNGYEPCQHTEPLPGNARYCPYCGNRTTFFADKVLSEWNAPDFADIADDNGELPF